eukprot:1675647-Amphidinium_carterae.1
MVEWRSLTVAKRETMWGGEKSKETILVCFVAVLCAVLRIADHAYSRSTEPWPYGTWQAFWQALLEILVLRWCRTGLKW